MNAIVYTSNTGFTAQYAKLLGEKLGLPVYALDEAEGELATGTEILYLGWLMAGQVKGYKQAAKRYRIAVVCGVGMPPDAIVSTGELSGRQDFCIYDRGVQWIVSTGELSGRQDNAYADASNKLIVSTGELSGRQDCTASVSVLMAKCFLLPLHTGKISINQPRRHLRVTKTHLCLHKQPGLVHKLAVQNAQLILPSLVSRLPLCVKHLSNGSISLGPHVETLYIALHICAALERRKSQKAKPRVIVVCDGGVGTSQLLAEELRNRFDIKIVKVLPAHDTPYIETYYADLVISTVPLSSCPVDTVVVRLPLREKGYQTIRAKLATIEPVVRLSDPEEEVTAQGILERIEPIIRRHDGS